MRPRRNLTRKSLKKLLSYSPETGVFRWLVARGNGVKAGDQAGTSHTDGYIRIQVNGRLYYAHRLAWLYMTGEWPPDGYDVDHKDCVPTNNRWSNLRLATDAENKYNRPQHRDNKCGLKGVHREGNRYRSQISIDGRQRGLGYFDHPEEAHEAYRHAAQTHHGEFANAGDERLWRRRWAWFICSRVWIEP